MISPSYQWLLNFLFLFIGLLFFQPIYAADEESSETEPLVQNVFIGDVVYPQEQGALQLTLAPTFENGRGEDTTVLPIFLEYGLTNQWEVELAWEAYKIYNPDEGQTTHGVGDLEVGTKYSFMHIHNSDYSVALGFDIGIPTGDVDKELSEGLMEYEPYAILAKDLPNFYGSQIYTQLGYDFVNQVNKAKTEADESTDATPVTEEAEEETVTNENDIFLAADAENPKNELFWNSGLIIPYKSLRYVLELNVETSQWLDNGDETKIYTTPGIIWHPNDTFEAGLGVPIGLTSDSDHYDVMAMLTVEV